MTSIIRNLSFIHDYKSTEIKLNIKADPLRNKTHLAWIEINKHDNAGKTVCDVPYQDGYRARMNPHVLRLNSRVLSRCWLLNQLRWFNGNNTPKNCLHYWESTSLHMMGREGRSVSFRHRERHELIHRTSHKIKPRRNWIHWMRNGGLHNKKVKKIHLFPHWTT